MSDSTRSRIVRAMAEAYVRADLEGPRKSAPPEAYVKRVAPSLYPGMEAALTAYESHLEAEGMAVVPVKPTPDMMMAGLQSMTVSTYHNGYADHIWAAMLSASPYGKASMQEASAERAARSEQIPPGKEESK